MKLGRASKKEIKEKENAVVGNEILEENSLGGISSKQRKSFQNQIIPPTKKKITNVSKKLENVEYLIKIEQKNKKQLEEKYFKEIQKLDKNIDKLERELELNLKEMNEKESKIFEIQKEKFEIFKLEIMKYDTIYNELEQKHINLDQKIKDTEVDENLSYNRTYMLFEDYLCYNQEIMLNKQKIIEFKESLSGIEKTYPKEFEFLLEDIQMEKELNELVSHRKSLIEEIDGLEKNKKEFIKLKHIKEAELKYNYEELLKLEEELELQKSDLHIEKIEDYISKNINDMMTFEKIKILIQNFYNQKNFDLENELNVLLVKNLGQKLKEMKNEFIQIKNEKILTKNKLEKFIGDLTITTRGSIDKVKYEKDLKQRQNELDRINNEISLLELNCKKKETLFNKYIIVLRSKCKKSAQDSYYEMNPAIVLETEFEEKLKDEIIKTIETSEFITDEEKIKNKNLVDIYFKEMINREKIIQSLYVKKKKTDENNEIILKNLEKLEESITLTETEITNKKPTVNNLIIKEKILIEKIQSRNRNLNSNLEQLGEIEFGKYLNSNDMVLTNMKKIYGNKVLDKVFKVQKQKILENVILDHSYKKSKINEFLNEINKLEQKIESYNSNILELESNYKASLRKFENLIDFKNSKIKEKNFLEESKFDLKEKIEMTLETQLKELENEKNQLQYKFNLNFYVEKAKSLGMSIDKLKNERDKYSTEYENFSNLMNEKEKKLYLEDLDLKNNLISLSMGVKDEHNPITVMPYKVNKSFNDSYERAKSDDPNNQNNLYSIKPEGLEENLNSNSDNFEDIIKRTVAECYKEGEETNQNEISRKDEENIYVKTGSKLPNSIIDLTNTNIEMKLDPFIELSVERIKPLYNGLNLYKKFNNSLSNTKVYDPHKLQENPPENCGYAIRMFKLNITDSLMEIKNVKSKHIESKINLSSIKGLLLGNSAKSILKLHKNSIVKNSQEFTKIPNSDFIPFNLLVDDGMLDLISPSYQIFLGFQKAIEELCGKKKNYSQIFKYLEK